MKEINIGICGLGTVAAGVLAVLQRNAEPIASRAGRKVFVSHIGTRSTKPDLNTRGIKVSDDIFAVVNDPDVDIVVELIGGYEPALDLVMQAIANGKHVVTANKIEWLAGIINGTGNYILTEMRDKDRLFVDVLADAQRLGYAEADPTFDIEGIDAAHKLAILASLAFAMPLNFDACFTEGISGVDPQDVSLASELGYRIKHLGITRRTASGVEMRVHPTLIPHRRLIANVDGVMNAVLVKGDAVNATLYYGAGAGAEPTASSVIADIVDLARLGESSQDLPALGLASHALIKNTIVPINDIESAYYLRVTVDDKPGVLSHITQILSDSGISLDAVLQKESDQHQGHGLSTGHVAVVLITNVIREASFIEAVNHIEALTSVTDKVTYIRVESLS